MAPIQHRSCLLIEDDPEDQETFMHAISIAAPDVGCFAVSNGEEALAALLVDNIGPDVIFMELHTPKMNGFDFVHVIRGLPEFRHIPVVALSDTFTEQDLLRLKELKVSAIYRKQRLTLMVKILERCFSPQISVVNAPLS